MSDFHINHDKFQYYSGKAIDWFIKSWELKLEDKEMALLMCKKNWRLALEYLELAKKEL